MSRFRRDRLLEWTLRCSGAIAALIVALIVLFLIVESSSVLTRIGPLRLATDPSWHPDPDAARGTFGLGPMITGTLWATLGAVLLAAPAGVGAAVFCHFYAPAPIARLFRKMLGLLAGIPSVVYGFWGLVVLVPLIGRYQPPGAGLLTGILILGVMILPTIALNVDAALDATPRAVLEGAAALGMSRWGTIWGIVLPGARGGVVTGILLGTGRALGETMAVLMVCGNVVRHPETIFDPIRTLTANIALEMAYAMGDHRGALFVSGLLLMIMVTGLILAAHGVSRGAVYD